MKINMPNKINCNQLPSEVRRVRWENMLSRTILSFSLAALMEEYQKENYYFKKAMSSHVPFYASISKRMKEGALIR